MNLFPHCYGETRKRTGIFFCTVAVPVAKILSGFLDKNEIYGLFFDLFDRSFPGNEQKKDFNCYVKDGPSHVLFR